MRKSLLRRFIDGQVALSRRIDALLPERFRIDGNADFLSAFAWKHIGTGQTVYDVGGGKNPLISASLKKERGLRVIGIDIDADELRRAPAGAYDRVICGDVCSYVGPGDGDIVICQALLEHVPDQRAAFRAISSLLRPGGKALIFVPSRLAAFARLNVLLPEKLKKKLLHRIFPQTIGPQGFRSYYSSCTPREFATLAEQHGMNVRETRLFYQSAYFTFFAPLHVAWRAWILAFYMVNRTQSAETFSMVLEKK